MSPEELAAAARVAGVKTVDGDPSALVSSIVQRLGETVGSASLDSTAVERDCLQWLCHELHISVAPDAQPATAENRILAPLLVQATRLTMPLWRVGAHMVAVNSKSVRQDGMELLERVFSRVMPAPDAMEAFRQLVGALPAEGAVISGVEMADKVRADATAVASHPDWVEPLLLLCLVLGFSDGKFNKEEERYYLAVAQMLGSQLEGAQALRDQTTATFWSRRARLAPRNTEKPSEVRANSLKAAFDTLEHVGAFTSLTTIVCNACMQAAEERGGAKTQKSWAMRWLAHLTGGGGRRDNTVLRIALMAYIRARADAS